MLKTVPFDVFEDKALKKINPGKDIETLRLIYNPQVFSEGLITSDLNFEHSIKDNIKSSTFLQFAVDNGKIIDFIDDTRCSLQEFSDFTNKHFENDSKILSSYGVCDNYEQVIEQYGLIESEGNFTVSITPMYKKNQSENGGWRWHKWGGYIGVQEPTCEYLYDEPDIELVYVFQIHKWDFK